MYAKPEKEIELHYFKCRVEGCENPYGLLFTRVTEAHVNWFEHASRLHKKDDLILSTWPLYMIKSSKFKVVKQ